MHELEEEEDDSRKLAAFHLHLQGPALTWCNGLSPDLTVWKSVKDLFVDKYVKIGWRHPSVVTESENFHNMVLAPSQEIEDYYCQLIEKGHLLDKPDHEIMFKFINGLPDKLAFYVRTSNPKDCAHALSIAKAGEAYKYRVHDSVSAARLNSATNNYNTNSDVADLKSKVDDLTNLVKNLATERPSNSAPRRTTGTKQPIICHNCNFPGHVKRYCQWNWVGQTSDGV